MEKIVQVEASIEEKIKDIICKIAHVNMSQISDNVKFKNMYIDSLDAVQIALAVEEHFDIVVLDDHLQDKSTFGEFVEHVKDRLQRRAS